jgi:hypothetical protein
MEGRGREERVKEERKIKGEGGRTVLECGRGTEKGKG